VGEKHVAKKASKLPPRKPFRVDIVGLGVNSVDTIIRLPRFPAFNSKVEILSSEVLPGGQVATAAVACQRWGLRARYIGKIGDDSAGRLQRAEFAREGVEAHLIEVHGCASQIAFILVDESTGERTILWQRDPRLDPRPKEIRREWIENARLLHVDGHPSAPAALAATWAQQAGIIVTADIDNLYSGVEALLEHVDYLIGSREFPQRLTGIETLTDALPEIRRRFGCRVVGATLGCDGALLWDGTAFHYCPAFRVATVDTTGAGDVFHAGLAFAVLQGWTLDRSIEFSCAAAALNCTARGARGGIRPVAEIEGLMRKGEHYPRAFRDGRLSLRIGAKSQNRATSGSHEATINTSTNT
jgi:sugar/nucleoside kinase (ribokinase family)